MKKMNTLAKVVGALSLGALVLTGCKSQEADAEAGGGEATATEEGGAAAEGEEPSCGGEHPSEEGK